MLELGSQRTREGKVTSLQTNMEQEQIADPSGGCHVIDIRALAEALKNEIRTTTTSNEALVGDAPACLISKVDERIRNVDSSEYDPHTVLIGPYHRNAHHRKEEEKLRLLNDVPGVIDQLEGLLESMAGLEHQARSCYAHAFEMTSEEFVRMLLLDGCYLLMCFVNLTGLTSDASSDNGSASSASSDNRDTSVALATVRDVVYLVENQIPFFVLEKIYKLITGNNPEVVVGKCTEYIQTLLEENRYTRVMEVMQDQHPYHLLYLLHMFFRPTNYQPAMGGTATTASAGRWRRASEYRIAGMDFKKRELDGDSVRCVLDMKLDGGTLHVPCLTVDNETFRLLRNLMALEQQNPGLGSHVTAYCLFLSQTACTAEDVALLRKREVVVNHLGNDGELAKYFSDLCKGVIFNANDPNQNYLKPVWDALERRCKSPARNWMEWLRHKHFRNPWVVIKLAAASIVVVCTVVQAVYAVLSYTPR